MQILRYFLYLILFHSLLLGRENFFDSLELQETFVLKSMSNDTYQNSPYLHALFESKKFSDNGEVDFGISIEKSYNDTYLTLNQASYFYYSNLFEFKIGKYVDTLGTLDYLSTVNIINPTNIEFFDDKNINIRKIPLLMSELIFYPNNKWKIQTIIQPFDTTHQDFTNTYVNIILNTVLPNYLRSEIKSSDGTTEDIYIPLYDNYVSPVLAKHIQDNYSQTTDFSLDKLGGFFVAEYLAQNATYGFVWMNRFSEISLVKINQDIVEILENLEDDESASEALKDYIASDENSLVVNVDQYRYNQASLYFESAVDRLGIRSEISYRDKIPILNQYSSMLTSSIGLDYKIEKFFNTLELQWIRIVEERNNIYTGVYALRSDAFNLRNVKLFFENYLLFGYNNTTLELSVYPKIRFEYNKYTLGVEYLASKENPDLNNFSVVARVSF
jgi:hypothetical protein